ncbi:MAG: tetratricopeptide repeat protein, partial [Chloroflexota bacterium]
GQFPAAIEALENSLELYRQTQNIGQMLGPLVNLGSVYQRVGEYEKGLNALKEGFEVSETIKDKRGSAHLLNNIGGILFSLGRLDEATDYFERCLKLCIETGYPMVQTSALLNLAEIGLKQAAPNLDQIGRWLDEGLAIAEKIEDKQKHARAHKLMGDLQLSSSDTIAAWESYKAGLHIVWQVKAFPVIFEILTGMGRHQIEVGQLELATKLLAAVEQADGAPQHIKERAKRLSEEHHLPRQSAPNLEELIENLLDS